MGKLPTISAPVLVTLNEDSIDFLIQGLSVSDADGENLTVTLSALGTFTLGQITGLTFSVGDGTDDSIMTFSGSAIDINAALAGLLYSPVADDDTGDSIDITLTGTEQTTGTFAATFDLSSLLSANGGDGSQGFVIKGIDAGDHSGFSVSAAGDVNGDGIDDFFIAAPNADPGLNGDAGESYVVFGTDQGFSAEFDLSSLNGTNGFVINGIDAGDQSGDFIASAGDINGDGFDDIVIGAFGADPGGIDRAGETYVIFGTDQGFSASMDLSSLNGTNGFVINGIAAHDFSGFSVASAGDVNGDGIDDLLIGAYSANPNMNTEAGETYVVFGTDLGFSASFDLSSLDGTNGFVLNGSFSFELSGRSVSSAGDINGDGIDDILIGAYFSDPGGLNNAGRTYVVFGSDQGFSASFNLSSLNGTNGFTITGAAADERSGFSVSSAGDVNGDGIDDIIIGAHAADPGGNSEAGTSYVVFGTDQGFASTLDLGTLNGTNGFAIHGIDADDRSGYLVSSAGDVNGDGIDDILIGAYLADPAGGSAAGESYVVFGTDQGFSASINLSSLNGTNGFVINGIGAGDQSGFLASAAGDVNGDGIDDILIGAPFGDSSGTGDAGDSYIIFGRANFSEVMVSDAISINIMPINDAPTIVVPSAITVDEDSIDVAVNGFSVADAEDDILTVTLSVEGTLSLGQLIGLTFEAGDGTDDSLMTFSGSVTDINAALAGLTYSGAANDDDGDTINISVADGSHVQVGPGTFAASFELSDLLSANGGDGSLGLVINGSGSFDRSGRSVSSAGDVNGDGIDDFLIGGYFADHSGKNNAGETYVVFGTDQGFSAELDLSSLNGTNGFTIQGIDSDDRMGFSVSAAGDVNGDGIDDIIVGAFAADPGSNSQAGESYVIFGTNSGFAATFDPSTLNGTNGFVINGTNADDRSGYVVSSAGDVNGDGIDDLLIGAYHADPGGNSDAGATYVVFGTDQGFSSSIDLSALNGSNGFVLNGLDAGDESGFLASAAGDVNGDGIDDIIIGAAMADPNGNGDSGEAYVVFGTNAGFSSSFDLSTLNGTNGFVINGIAINDETGALVSSAGDINGDGIDDLLIGAPNANSASGSTYVVFGTDQGFSASIDLSSLDGTNGFALTGLASGDHSGESAASAGDINGDGIDDLIIGAWDADPNGTRSGETYVVFGTDQGFAANFDLSTLDGTNGFVINGIDVNDRSGFSVSSAGDVNGDGIDDLLIGAYSADANGNNESGQSYIIFGRADFADVVTNGAMTVNHNPINDDPTVGSAVTSTASEDDTAYSVDLLAGASDVDVGDVLSVANLALVSGDASGVTVNGNNLDIDPAAYNSLAVGESEIISYTYDIIDGNGGTVAQTATVTITGENDAPTVAAAITSTANEDDIAYSVDLLDGASDVDASDTLNVSNLVLVSGDASGVTVNGNSLDIDPSVYDSLAVGESVVIDYTYDVIDGNGGTVAQTATVTITGTNDAPTVAAAVSATASEDDVACTIDLLAGANDVDATDTLNVANLMLDSGDASGVTVNGNSLDLDPSAYNNLAVGESMVITYSYDIIDGNGGSINQTATLTINGANDAPTVSAAITSTASQDDAAYSVDLLTGAADVDTTDILNIANLALMSGDASGVTINGNSLDVDPAAYAGLALGESMVITYSYDVIDGNGGSVAQTATLTITGTNDGPVISGDLTFETQQRQDTVLTLADIGVTDADSANSDLTFTISALNAGTIELNGVSVTSFTQADLVAGLVVFAHDGTTTNGSFDFIVTDNMGLTTGGATAVLGSTIPLFRQEGDSSNNTLFGTVDAQGRAGDYLIGNDGNDLLRGFDGNDLLRGGNGNDILRADDGDDEIRGDAGNDTIYGGGGADDIRGGSGIDTVWYRYSSAGVTADLDGTIAGSGDAAGDTYSLIERLRGSDFDDILYGQDGMQDRLLGGDGDDELHGRGGNDFLFGGAGADILDGGDGTDYASYFEATSGVTIDLSNGALNTGDAAGDTFISIERFFGSQFADTFDGDGTDNYVRGLNGNDILNGRDGGDRLFGEGDDDTLNGGNGIDRLYGGQGNDTLTGGADKDLFYFESSAGVDTITDFEDGTDIMVFMNSSGANSFADLTLAQSGDDVLVTFAEGIVVIENTQLADIDTNDFSFL